MLDNNDHENEQDSGTPSTPPYNTQPPQDKDSARNDQWSRPEGSQNPNTYGQNYYNPNITPQNPNTPPPYNPNGGYNNYNAQRPHPPANPNQPPQNPNQYNPYQFGQNSGWQQTPPPQEKYQWSFEDYDKVETKGKKKKRGSTVFVVMMVCILSVGLVFLSGYSVYTNFVGTPATAGEITASSSQTDGANSSNKQMEIAGKPQISESLPIGGKLTIPQVAKSVSPSVVGIIKYSNSDTQYYEPTGAGSGIIMSEDGYIITNAHVIEDATDYKVILSDETPYEATLIGLDKTTDLALLKIDATGLTPASFGDSNEVEVGETVVAIGNPAGLILAGSVTQGIVSAVNREVKTPGYSMHFIQTDAAINPGNSGGALVNEYGQVIGINTSKIVAEGYEGISFAIPISEAKPIIDDILTNGRVTGRVLMGVECLTIDEVDAKVKELPMGLQIQGVYDYADENTKRNIMKGDIITHIDGERIYDFEGVKSIISARKPGDKVTLTISRKIGVIQDKTFDITITLVEDQQVAMAN